MAKPIRASRKDPCPACGGKKWPCYQTANREVAGCGNVPSDRRDKDGLYLHILVEREGDWRRPPVPPAKVSTSRPASASPEHLHLVYISLLSRLGLSEERLEGLLSRGLTRDSIERNFYRDTPTKEQSERLARAVEDLGLAGVPGFHRRGGRARLVGCLPGFFVPYKDVEGRIVGLSYRLDAPLGKTKYLWVSTDPETAFDDGRQKYPGGTKLSPPLHFARPDLIPASPDILLTEGSLKAQIAAELLGLPVIGAGGVTLWGGGFAEAFKRRFNGKRAVICYDADWRTNSDVLRALETLMASLREAGVRYVVRSWPWHEAKGIDDLALMLSRFGGKGVLAA